MGERLIDADFLDRLHAEAAEKTYAVWLAVEELRAGRDRLKEALEQIVGYPVDIDTDPAQAFAAVRQIARESLRRPTGGADES